MKLSQSLEDYLETIFELDKTKKAVRVKDISNKLGVKMSSVNSAVKNLETMGFVKHEKYEYIELTDSGLSAAKNVAERHTIIYSFLKDVIGVDPITAEQDACKIEHVISPETADKLENYIKNSGISMKADDIYGED